MGRKILASIFATAALCLMACSSSSSGTSTSDECLDDPSLPICQDNPMPDTPQDDPMPGEEF